jgi:hypothetical protein
MGELSMSINPVLACLAVFVALASAQVAAAQNQPTAPAAPAAATSPPAPAIADQADRLLKEVGDSTMLNAVLVLMLATSILGPVLTERFAPRMLGDATAPERVA